MVANPLYIEQMNETVVNSKKKKNCKLCKCVRAQTAENIHEKIFDPVNLVHGLLVFKLITDTFPSMSWGVPKTFKMFRVLKTPLSVIIDQNPYQ